MTEVKKEKLQKLAEEFLIGKGFQAQEVIDKLKNIETFEDSEKLEALSYFAMTETDPDVLLYLVKKLQKHKEKTSIDALIDILTNSNGFESSSKYLNIRCLVAKTLGNMMENSAVLPLMYIMNDKNENYKLRLSAADALGRIGSSYAVNPLISIVSDESEKSVYLRESAAKALGALGDERAVDPLINLLETKKGIIDKFTFLREKIIESLGKLNFKKHKKIDALRKVLLDESAQIRISAIYALAEVDDESVIPIIESMIFDKNEEVALEAINALYESVGREYLIELLEKENLPAFCRDEINEILEDEVEDE